MFVAGCGGGGESQRDKAIAAAQVAFRKADAQGRILPTGPCIAEHLAGAPDWVVDIAHDPRLPVDDRAANQCARFHSGGAEHFVELTPGGRLIRAE
jgi:hypothetical protein